MAQEWVLRQIQQETNPNLPGGVYGAFITLGRPVYFNTNGATTTGILFICDGGHYGIDSVQSFEYKGNILTPNTQWKLHRGTFTKQITPYAVTAIDTSSNVLTVTAPTLVDGNLVRFGVTNGNLPTAVSGDILDPNAKYLVSDKTSTTMKLKTIDGSSYIDFADAGTGTIRIWSALAGFDDPEQGLPTFCPEVDTTFNNIAYIEFSIDTDNEEPDWQDFRIIGTGRRLMNYDGAGNEIGIISTTLSLLSNAGLIILDNLLVNYKIKKERIHWSSWLALTQIGGGNIWHRFDYSGNATGLGLTGRYYQNQDFTDLRMTRTDSTINFTSSTVPPTGMTLAGFSIRWNGKIKPEFSETYTFTLTHDDVGSLWVNGQLLINHVGFFTQNPSTASITLQAGEVYDIQVEIVQDTAGGANAWAGVLQWQSPSQSIQVVPQSRLYPSDNIVQRYGIHVAFPQATDASEVHETLMERCPGWDWTDNDGKIEFLPPNRTVAMAFAFDRMDDDSVANFAKGTFRKTRRPLSDRKNFKLGRYRDVAQTGYPFAYVQADREDLRRFTNGEPSNDPAIDFGVSTQSLAQRMLEMEMVRKTDPKYTASISGSRSSSKLRKNQLVTVSYYDLDGNYVVDESFLIAYHGWGSSDSRNDFSLLPTPVPFYEDESAA